MIFPEHNAEGGVPHPPVLEDAVVSHQAQPISQSPKKDTGYMPHLFGTTATISEEEKQKRLHALQKAKQNAGSKNLKDVPDDIIFDPRMMNAMKYYDTNGDGELDIDEVVHIMNDLNKRKEQVDWLKKIVAIILGALIILLVANTLLTFWVVQLTKEVEVNGDSLTSTSGNIVKTDKPRYYATVSDIGSLPASALNALTRLSFTTSDGGVHNYEVLGIRMDASETDKVFVYFTSNKELQITKNVTYLYSYDSEKSVASSVTVVTDSASSTSSRRLEAMKDHYGNSMAYDNFLSRCSDSGVCYHTYDEMMTLHQSGLFSHRLLTDSNSVNYIEVSADASILAKDSRSSLTLATSFLEGILGDYTNVHNGTLSISFTMKERCSNYDNLEDACRKMAVPENNDAIDYVKYAPPYRGLTANAHLWWFFDEIEYNKDAYTIQLKVRYAHDQLKANRLHVVMISRQDSTKIIAYDEVTTANDPANPGYYLASPVTYMTNYQVLASTSSEDGLDSFSTSTTSTSNSTFVRRGLSISHIETIFHNHIRTKLEGFPDIYIADELLEPETLQTVDMKNPHFMRRLVESQSVSLSADLTSKGTHCVGNIAQASVNSSGITATSNSTYTYADPTTTQNDEYAPCAENLNVTDMAAPKAVFSEPMIVRKDGLITWPSPTQDIVDVTEFNDIIIPHRSELALLSAMHITAENLTTNSSDGRRLAIALEHINPKDIEKFSRKVEEFMAKQAEKKQKLSQHFDNLELAFNNAEAHFTAVELAVNESKANPARRQLALSTATRAALIKRISNFLSDKSTRDDFNTIKKLYGNMITMTTMPNDVNTMQYSVRTNNTCASMKAQWSKLIDHLLYYNDIIYRINLYATTIDKGLDSVYAFKTSLASMVTLDSSMQPVMPLISKIPYIGPATRTFYNSYHSIVSGGVDPVSDRMDEVTAKIDKTNFRANIKKLITYTEKVYTKISLVGNANTFAASALMVVDKVCPQWPYGHYLNYNLSATAVVCLDIHDFIYDINISLDALRAPYLLLVNYLQGLADFFQIIIDFNAKFSVGLITILKNIFIKIRNFLDYDIRVCIPLDPCIKHFRLCLSFEYPCGVDWCWYGPCGIDWCSYDWCMTIYYPSLCDVCFSFSVSDIIDAVMSVLEIVEDALMALLKTLANALHISFPTFSLPSLPSLGNFDYYLNLFSLTFDLFTIDLDWNLDVTFDGINLHILSLTWPKC